MVRKITYFDRKKMFEAREKGLSDAQIKAQFGIKDKRTLDRAMKLAQQEQQTSVVRLQILKDALADHLGEIRSLIEGWLGHLRVPLPREIREHTLSPASDLENYPLFGSLREHLPVPTLWRDYSIWANKVNEYVNLCKKVIEQCSQEVGKWEGVRRTTDSFARPILELLNNKIEGKTVKNHKFERKQYFKEESGERMLDFETLTVDGHEVLEATRALAYTDQYKALSDRILKSEMANNLVVMFGELKALEPKIRASLSEVLLKRDYIMYTCRFCPGQPRLSR